MHLRLRSLFKRSRVENELDEELQFHLEKQVEENIAAGMSAAEARYSALRSFGDLAQRKDECRDARRLNMIDNFMQDLRYAFRGLRRQPMLMGAATLTLAICIGANTTMFSLVNSVLLRPLPFPASERVYALNERMGKNQMAVSLGADYYSLREENKVFEDVAAYDSITVNWSGIDKAEQLLESQVTPSFFRVLGTAPLLGRYLAPEEAGIKAPAVVVLSYPFWRSRLASDPNAVGKTITLDRLPWTVIGVMPQGFDYPKGTQLWRPLDMDESSQRPRSPMRPMRMVEMLARLKPGVGQLQLNTELKRLASVIYAEYPKSFDTAGFISGLKVEAMPLQRRITGDLRPALLVLSFAVGLVLLIACANLANLLLARAAAQQRELAVRMALGSSRGRIVRQVLTESLALALPGGFAGVMIATLAIRGLNAWKPLVLAHYPAIVLDMPTLAFTFGLTLLTGLVFGMAPAFAAAGVHIQDALKSATQTQSGGRSAARLRHLLVVAELGVSLILLIGAGLLFKSFVKLSRTDLGFSTRNLLTLRVNLAGSGYATAESQVRFYENVLERVRQLPMVRMAAVSTDTPLSGQHAYAGMAFQVAGRAPLPLAERPQASVTVISREFFRTLGIPLRSGRTFGTEDTISASDKIVVNEAFVKKILPGEEPIGQRIVFGRNDSSHWTIAGVVGNVRANELGVEPTPLIYRCTCQGNDPHLTRMRLIVRTTSDPRGAIPAVEGQIHAVDRNQPVFETATMDERLEDSLAPQRFQLLLIGTFAVIAIILAAVGVYGVMSYLVTRRTREIGIRVAMGARPEQVLGLVVGESFTLAVVSVLAGLGGAWALTRYLQSMLYGVTALDGAVFAIMPAVLIAISVVAALAPARRAARIDPMTALRES